MKRETEIFNKMIGHYIKSVASDATQMVRQHHHDLYKVAKHELWKLQEEKNAKFD